MATLKSQIEDELGDFWDDLKDEHREDVAGAVADISHFTSLMLANPTPDNVEKQKRNIAHVMNTLQNHAAQAQYQVANRVRAGELEVVLEQTVEANAPLSVVYADREFIEPRVRVFVDRDPMNGMARADQRARDA